MITPHDDFPVHQTPVPLATNPMGLNAYDRYFFNGYSPDGLTFFALAFGVYPNRGVVDAAISILHGGRQRSLFTSRRLTSNLADLRVGPITINIVQPMSEIQLVVDDDDLGLDLTFLARTGPVEEPRFTNASSGFGTMDYTRYTQFGNWTGELTIDGRRQRATELLGCRDRSWGQRPVGGPSGAAPELPQFFWLWAPLSFPDGALHFDVNDYPNGSRWHEGGFTVPLLEPGVQPWESPVHSMRSVNYELEFDSGTRWAKRASLELVPWSGDTIEVELEFVQRFQMKGIGYGHPDHRHGSWQGELVVAKEDVLLEEVDPLDPSNFHVQQVVLAHAQGRRGTGVLEVLAVGPHGPSGFTGTMDVAS